MGKFEAIKNAINANIKINGRSEITGGILNGVLIGMVEEVDSVKQDVIADLEDIRRNAAEAIKDIPEEYVTDDELSQALNSKVDKESGKQLSTEDFTTELKAKLEGLSNYDDTAIQNAVNALAIEIDTLVNGDASKAIESFNEIIAFLEGVEDSENLESIIAAIEKQITAKQDKVDDLDDIRGGAAKGATAIQKVKTINGQSIEGEGDITIEGGSEITIDSELSETSENPVQNKVVTETLNDKADISYVDEQITDLTNEMIANEEVHAGAYNDLNTRLNELSENVHGETITKEEFNAAIEGVNNGISAKQDVLVSGTNIKSINGESILGSGDIKIGVDTSTLTTKEELQNLQNEVIANEEVAASAINDLNTRLAALEAVIANL